MTHLGENGWHFFCLDDQRQGSGRVKFYFRVDVLRIPY
jgi:hypothetical protein